MGISSLEQLKLALSNNSSYSAMLEYDEEKIIIKFHDDYIIHIKEDKNYNQYHVYINNIYYYGIDGEDIEESIESLQEDIVIEIYNSKERKDVYTITEKNFEKQRKRLLNKIKIKIYNAKTVIYKRD